jgi:hypothetical protein
VILALKLGKVITNYTNRQMVLQPLLLALVILGKVIINYTNRHDGSATPPGPCNSWKSDKATTPTGTMVLQPLLALVILGKVIRQLHQPDDENLPFQPPPDSIKYSLLRLS